MERNWKAAKHLLRYIRGTSDLCLTFTAKSGDRIALGHADAYWGGDLDTQRSTRSMAALLRGKAGVSQPLLCLLPKQSTWHQQMQHDRLSGLPLDDLQLGLGNKPFPIMNDDAGTIALSKNPVHHERSKHIGLRHHFLRERVEDKTISLSHVPSADNSADLLTKGLPRELFDRLRDLLGVTARSDRVGVSG